MVRGGVASDVMVERVLRMQDVPTLDAAALGTLMSKGVPDVVLLELARKKPTAAPCEIPERKVGVREVLDHPSIREVLYQVDTGVATDAMVERVGHLQRVPVLDARAIARLTSQGVPDKVLLELVRRQEIRTGCDPVRAELLAAAGERERAARDGASTPRMTRESPGDPTFAEASSYGAEDGGHRQVEQAPKEKVRSSSHRPDAAAAGSPGMGRIRVVAKSSLPVTYLEVHLDGAPVTRKGEVQEGETKPGWMLPPPPVLDVKRGAVVFESDLPVGPYEVQTTFALSRIVETDWDAVVEARGQRYDTAMAGPAGEKGEVPVCEVREGRTCVVLARLLKKGDGYAVAYDSTMR